MFLSHPPPSVAGTKQQKGLVINKSKKRSVVADDKREDVPVEETSHRPVDADGQPQRWDPRFSQRAGPKRERRSVAKNKSKKRSVVVDGNAEDEGDAPVEESSHCPVTHADGRPQRWDPRFSQRAGGTFDRTTFRKRYAFLDEMREKELKVLKRAQREMRREGDVEQASVVKEQAKRLENQVRSTRLEKLEAEARSQLRRTNIERMRQGLKPVYLNNQELRKRVWERRYEQLREKGEGHLDTYLEKRARSGKKIY